MLDAHGTSWIPSLRDLQRAADARGEQGPLDAPGMRSAHQLGYSEGYAAGLEAAAKACEGDKTHPVAQAYAKTIRALGKEEGRCLMSS